MEHYPLYNVSDEQRANLLALADYLDKNKAKIAFHMGTFYRVSDTDHDRYTDASYLVQPKHECGSVACAIGHGPAAGILPTKDEVKDRMTWVDYAHKYLGIERTEGGSAEGALWDWCFSAGWVDADNSPQGAAARIRYALGIGIPERAWEIKRGYDPLPYEV